MRREADYLHDILDAAQRIASYLTGQTAESFATDVMCQDAVLYRLAVIGEAAGRVSKASRDAQPAIPWMKVIGMRNILVHDYFGVDVDITWRTATTHVPELAEVVQRMLPPESPNATAAAGGPSTR
jgi:uncharacterized protein with HEPN domain